MPILKETQKAVSKDDPQKLLKYAVREIHIDESNSKIKVFIRDDVNFNRIIEALKEIYDIKNKLPNFPDVPFNTKCYNKTKSFIFEKDIIGAIDLLLSLNAISKVTHKEALSQIANNNSLSKTPVRPFF